MPHLIFLSIGLIIFSAHAALLQVGPGRTYARIEAAYAAAAAGDTIDVYPQSNNTPYQKTVVYFTKKRIVIRAQPAPYRYVALSGEGYDYSGSGSVPRAMFQFNPGTDSCAVEGFEITGCHNSSYNGAAFRINQANGITIRACHIYGNDMGIMSNGSASQNTASDQFIEHCTVHDNGNLSDPGYNHNFYLGGTSASIRGCEVYNATTGHNIKSRAHVTIIEGCYVHDSPNREFDLVDEAGNTTVAGSHALISGCVIVKDPYMTGNRTVIHFGQDGGNDHNGTLYIVHCTIATPYTSPVVDLSAQNAGAALYNTILVDLSGGAGGQNIVTARNNANILNAAGQALWISNGFLLPIGTGFSRITTGVARQVPPFADTAKRDFHLSGTLSGLTDAGLAASSLALPDIFKDRELRIYVDSASSAPRIFKDEPDVGAYEYGAQQIRRASAGLMKNRISATMHTSGTLVILQWGGSAMGDQVFLQLFDSRGRPMENLVSRGTRIEWNRGKHASGLYFIRAGVCRAERPMRPDRFEIIPLFLP